jgi:hypothetical protein
MSASCCDSAPHRHARTSGHPIARSTGPGEQRSWCYLDEVAFIVGRRG